MKGNECLETHETYIYIFVRYRYDTKSTPSPPDNGKKKANTLPEQGKQTRHFSIPRQGASS